MMAKEWEVQFPKSTIFQADDEPMGMEMLFVALRGGSANKDIIQTAESRREPLQNTIHQMLKGMPGVMWAEQHPKKLP